MAKAFHHYLLSVLIFFVAFYQADQLQSSQTQTLLRIQSLLNLPSDLSSWNNNTDFCNMEPNPSQSVTVVCYDEMITQLHIIGKKGAVLLPQNFSIDSFITTIIKLPNLKVLTLVSLGLWGPLPAKIARLSTLEILNISSNFIYGVIPQELSLLTNLQTLILDDNMLAGQFPVWVSLLPALTVLNLKSNFLNGSLPDSFVSLENLRVISLSHNHLYGDLPDLRPLENLEVLELEDNAFGPKFPQLGKKLVTLNLSKNKLRSNIPPEITSFYQLQWLDFSFNTLIGPFPPALLSLPSLTHLNLEGNELTGMLFENLSCNGELRFVDLSSNLLTGSLPSCLLSNSRDKVFLYGKNCLATGNQNQHPISFCHNEALAVGILPQIKKRKQASKAVVALGIIGGIVGSIAIVVIVLLFVRRQKKTTKKPPTKLIAENAASSRFTSKLLSDARYISQTMKTGMLGLSAYRAFSLEEIVEATNNFDSSTFMGEGSQGQMYRGRLKDGSFVAVRCLKMKRSYTTQDFMPHIEIISKLRHLHLVSCLGHCFECYLDDSSVSRIFLVFDYVPNGSLRSWISEGNTRKSLTWSQRIAAAIGIAKGIQFLHTVPAVYSNNIKITDVLLDQNLVAKISSYHLPLLAESLDKVGHGVSSGGSKNPAVIARNNHGAQSDIYDFGVILLEIIMGVPLNSKNEVLVLKDKVQEGILSDNVERRRRIVDGAVEKECWDQSLKTMMEVCVRCLMKDPTERASIEDVLWNLQFAAQVQDAWRGDGSPISPP